ncbi:hypothetical protein OIU78_013484 [Salix suchowensis]|nr:hypothetical protein OIU78_013484 [Salix suchowensis]
MWQRKGFDQAIDLFLEILSNVKFVEQTRLIGKSWKMSDRMENTTINRYVLKNIRMDEITIKHLNREQEADQSNFKDSITSSTSSDCVFTQLGRAVILDSLITIYAYKLLRTVCLRGDGRFIGWHSLGADSSLEIWRGGIFWGIHQVSPSCSQQVCLIWSKMERQLLAIVTSTSWAGAGISFQ